MDMDTVKRAVDSIELGADAKERILSGLTAGNAPVRRRRRLRPGALIAAAVVAALLVTGAGAAYVRVYRNPEIVDGWEAVPTPGIGKDGVPLEGHSAIMGYDYTPPKLEGKAAELTRYAMTWDSDKYLAGSVGTYHDWTDFEVLTGSGDVLVRNVFSDDGAVKREYTAEDPALLAEYLPDSLNINFKALREQCSVHAFANLYYAVYGPNGSFDGDSLKVVYGSESGDGWLELSCTTSPSVLDTGDYAVANTFDATYLHVNTTGLEFLITKNGDSISATCVTGNIYISVRGAYITTADMESVLDCIALA